LSQSDSALAVIIDAVGPYDVRPSADPDILESLIKSVISQQLSTSAARTIHGRLIAVHGYSPTAEQLIEMDDVELRSLGISGPKIRTIRGLATASISGKLPTAHELQHLNDAQIVSVLTQLHGIGEWTAHMIMIFTLGRPDIIAHGDLGVRKGLQRVDGLTETPTSAELLKRAEAWKPWRSVASWYLWRSLELPMSH
jgi:3-methyladenine DNA glycosylase/8-oxoguanine DNA glycosylase